MEQLAEIGTKVYLVNKNNANKHLSTILICKIKTYQNNMGKIVPICTEIGNSRTVLSGTNYFIFTNQNDALEAIISNDKNYEIQEVSKNTVKFTEQLTSKDFYKAEAMKAFINKNQNLNWDENKVKEAVLFSNLLSAEIVKRQKE